MAQLYKLIDYDTGKQLKYTDHCTISAVRSAYSDHVEGCLNEQTREWTDQRIDNGDGTFSMYLDEWDVQPFSIRFEIVPVDTK